MAEPPCVPPKSSCPDLVHYGPVPEGLEARYCGMVVAPSKLVGKMVTMAGGVPWREYRKSRKPKEKIRIRSTDGPVFIAATCSKPQQREQSRVVRSILGGTENCIVQGGPGKGKTATACKLVEKALRNGFDVVTLALAVLAAQYLPSGRVGSTVFEPKPFARLSLGFASAVASAAAVSENTKFLIVCDEFSMVDAKIWSAVEALRVQLSELGKKARVVLFGDFKQLGPPGGGTFASTPVAVSLKTDLYRLTHTWRFQDAQLAALIDAMEAGDWLAALPPLRRLQSKPEGRPDGGVARHIATTNVMVDKLNDREEREAIKAGARCAMYSSKAGSITVVADFEYRITKNKFEHGEYAYVNGTIGTIDFKNVPPGTVSVDKGTLLPFRTTDGVLINVSPCRVGSNYTYDGVIRANVANTVHNAQGSTRVENGDHTHLWVAGASLPLLYVAFSRFQNISQFTVHGLDLAHVKKMWTACKCGCFADSVRRERAQLPPRQCNQKRKRQIEDFETRLACTARIVPARCDCSKRPRIG